MQTLSAVAMQLCLMALLLFAHAEGVHIVRPSSSSSNNGRRGVTLLRRAGVRRAQRRTNATAEDRRLRRMELRCMSLPFGSDDEFGTESSGEFGSWAAPDLVAAASAASSAAASRTSPGSSSSVASKKLNASRAPSSSSLPEMYKVDGTPDPKGNFKCLEVKTSLIPGAGMGLFAKCDLPNSTTLGEYRGERFQIGMRGSAQQLTKDWSYIWKLPKCDGGLDTVITRQDKVHWHECSNEHGFLYVDAFPLRENNPLRYVNGVNTTARTEGSEKKAKEETSANVDAFFAADRVFYFTTKPMKVGEEFLVDYGANYWRKAKTGNTDEDMDGGDGDANWDNFASDS